MTGYQQVVDLHLHSTASDGTLTPSEVVYAAEKANAVAIALTDHDTLKGYQEAAPIANRDGIELIRGVELNTDANQAEIDILGYFAGEPGQRFIDFLSARENSRIERALGIVDKLKSLGIDVDYDRVRELAQGVVARPHIAQVMIEKGYVETQKEAYDRYIGFGAPAYVERDQLTPERAIIEISASGGLPIIAHPGLINDDNTVESLLRAGAAGLEAYYAFHQPDQISKYSEMAHKLGKIVTCGSDSHGPGRTKSQPIGSMPAPAGLLDAFHKKLMEAYQSVENRQ